MVAIFLSCLILHDWLQGEATRLSNAAYSVGSMLMELSLAANNLAQAGSGNGGPMLSAQTGFLSLDGSHSHVTNRVPGPPPPDLMSRSYRIPLSGGIPLDSMLVLSRSPCLGRIAANVGIGGIPSLREPARMGVGRAAV